MRKLTVGECLNRHYVRTNFRPNPWGSGIFVATGAGYNHVQCGMPPRAVANPKDPSYSYGGPFVSKLVMTTLCKKWVAITVIHRVMNCIHLICPMYKCLRLESNWIKRSKPFLGADQGIKETSELLKSIDQEHMPAIWSLTLWKSSTQNLDPGRKCLNKRHVSGYTLVLAGVYCTILKYWLKLLGGFTRVPY